MIIVSACLLGINCKYNGGNNLNRDLVNFLKDKEYMSICPEALSGLGIPRNPLEIKNGKIITESGEDYTEKFYYGIKRAMDRIRGENIEFAVLQSRSPSCGVNEIYDGTFSHTLIKGKGLFAFELEKSGVKTIDVSEFNIY